MSPNPGPSPQRHTQLNFDSSQHHQQIRFRPKLADPDGALGPAAVSRHFFQPCKTLVLIITPPPSIQA